MAKSKKKKVELKEIRFDNVGRWDEFMKILEEYREGYKSRHYPLIVDVVFREVPQLETHYTMSKIQLAIYNFICDNDNVTLNLIDVNVASSKARVREALMTLTEAGRIKKVMKGKRTTYVKYGRRKETYTRKKL